jgi:hypothetical protein
MQGRYNQAAQTLGQQQELLAQMGDELVRTQAMIRQVAPAPQPPPPPAPLLTEADVQTYGPELIDTIKRAAREAVMPDLQQVQNQNRRVAQQVEHQGVQGVYTTLDTQVPDWRTINREPRFKQWCALRDVYSGHVRGAMLNAAFQAADAPRVIAFFKGFLDEEQATGHGQPASQPQPAPQPPRVAAVPLESLTAPGRAKPAPGNTEVPVDKPIITRAQITAFYRDVRTGAYNGREQDKATHEAMIFAAQREGRVRG